MSTFSNNLSASNEAGFWTSVRNIPTENVLVSVHQRSILQIIIVIIIIIIIIIMPYPSEKC